MSGVNNKKIKIWCNTRTDGPTPFPKALRNAVNAAALKWVEVLLMKTEKKKKQLLLYTKALGAQKTVVSPLSISVVLFAALALKSDSSFLWTSALLANTNDSGSGQRAKVLPWLSREKAIKRSNQYKQSLNCYWLFSSAVMGNDSYGPKFLH